jgi:hypothetical protein
MNQAFDLAPDPTLFRPTGEPVIFGNSSELKAHSGSKQIVSKPGPCHLMTRLAAGAFIRANL